MNDMVWYNCKQQSSFTMAWKIDRSLYSPSISSVRRRKDELLKGQTLHACHKAHLIRYTVLEAHHNRKCSHARAKVDPPCICA